MISCHASYDLGCTDSFNENAVRVIADKLGEYGLRERGYKYLNLGNSPCSFASQLMVESLLT